MKLSIIVLNNNASALLKQAINSLIISCKTFDYEIIITDSSSSETMLDSIQNEFHEAHIILNDVLQGLAKTSNQAIQQAKGEYILLVNADTICCKDSLEKVCAFMDEHSDAGGIGVRMISPQGRFLPESIHGLTKQWASFFKFIGFAKHLSKTRLYNRNRKDWVEEFQIAEVDILNNDFMLLRKSVLNETGLFDERFIRFGHNIDLSYRIRLAGFKNYYFPKTYIINFGDQHPAKFSWSYIKYFYGAMFIFAIKYLLKVPQIKVEGIPQLFPSTYEVK